MLFVLFSTSCVISWVTVQAQFQGFGGEGAEAKFCPPYRCGKGQEAVPKWPLSLKSTGCSFGGGMMMMGAGVNSKDPYESCCDIRHACVQTCGTIKTHCNEEFLKCAEATCDGMPTTEAKESCTQSLGIQKMMMGMDQSCQQFDSDQNHHCECVASGKAANEKRERVLRNFYKKYAPENIDKVPALMKKIENSRKMAGLLLKLYKKFPKAIQKVKDPQQEMYEKLMKESKDAKSGEETKEDEDDVEDLGTDEL